MEYGLKQEEMERIRDVLRHYGQIEKGILYGSRAKGNYRPDSDIDITLVGETLDLSKLLHIENDLDDLLLPYKMDLSLLHKIQNTDLTEHIRRTGIIFYTKE